MMILKPDYLILHMFFGNLFKSNPRSDAGPPVFGP